MGADSPASGRSAAAARDLRAMPFPSSGEPRISGPWRVVHTSICNILAAAYLNCFDAVLRLFGPFFRAIGPMGQAAEILDVKVVNIGKGMGDAPSHFLIMGKMGKPGTPGTDSPSVEGSRRSGESGRTCPEFHSLMRIACDNRHAGFGMPGIHRPIVRAAARRIVREEFHQPFNGGAKFFQRSAPAIRALVPAARRTSLCRHPRNAAGAGGPVLYGQMLWRATV